MIDIKILRSNPQLVRDSIAKRNLKIDLDAIIARDVERVELQQELDLLRMRRNDISSQMGSGKPESHIIIEARDIKEKIQTLEVTYNETENEYKLMLASLPNFLDPTAAIGPDESGNVIETRVGTPRVFDFPIRAHHEIGEARGWIDIEKGAEVSGARFWYLKGDLVLLQFAIMNYVMNEMVGKGFVPMIPPYLVREPALYGTGFFPADRSQIYSVNPGEDDLFLIGTSEVPLTSYHGGEIMDMENAVKYVGYSACFRREAGTYGKDMKGILRGHQFDKIEMVCFCKPEDSQKVHDDMVALEESVWQSLGIPYNKLNVCSGDLGNPAMKKYDLEAWMPAQQQYREVTSCSNVGSFQSRRLGIRYRKEN